MSFRRLFTLKSVLPPVLHHDFALPLSRLSAGSFLTDSAGVKFQGSFHALHSPLPSSDVVRYSTVGSKLTLFGECRGIKLFHTSQHYIYQGRNVHSGRTRYSETSKKSTEKKEDDQPPEKMSIFQKFKAMYRDYWYVLVPVHVVTSGMFFGTFYYMAQTGVDIAALAEWAHLSEDIVEKIRKTGHTTTGYLAIAYLLYKVATPLRYTVTIGGTTISINYLKKWGWIKPMPKRDELRKMYDDKKVELRKKRELMKKSMMSKLPSKKRIKTNADVVNKVLARKKNVRKG